MKNLHINQKLMAILLTGALSFSLVGCSESVEYLPFQDIFYDDNSEGYDDVFENSVSDSDLQISNMIKLERCISLIPRLMKVNYRDVYELLSEEEVRDHYEDVSMEQLDMIEEELRNYNDLNHEAKTEENRIAIGASKKKLYRQLIYLINYVTYNGKPILHDFGNRLYDSILLGTCGYEGNEKNVIVLLDSYQGSGSPTVSYARYSYLDQNELIDISHSQLYNLVSEVEKYDNSKDGEYTVSLYCDYLSKVRSEVLDMLNQYQHSIDIYKESMVTSYYAEEYHPGIFDEVSYDKKLTSGDQDTSYILKK